MKPKQENTSKEASRVSCIIWLSSGIVLCLLLTAIMLMPQYRPLVRLRGAQQSVSVMTSTESMATNEDMPLHIRKIYNRRGYSNPNPDPADIPEDTSSEIDSRIGHPHPVRRRPLQNISEDFDPNQSFTIKHPNGTMVYLFPANMSVYQSSEGTDEYIKIPNQESNKVNYRTTGSNSSDSPELEMKNENTTCTTQYPWCSGIRTADENKIIDQIMASHKNRFAGVFVEDVVVPQQEDGVLQIRFDISDDLPFCIPRKRIIHPQYGFTRDEKKLTVVNTDEYIQGVRVEYCDGPGKPCTDLKRIFNYVSKCKQMYHFRTLLAIHPDTKKPFKEQFKLPSCCKCVIKKS